MSILTPIRPCKSYNLFFQLEKQYILQILLGNPPDVASNGSPFDPNFDQHYFGPTPLPSRYSNILLQSDWYLHEKGTTNMTDPMSRRISEAWLVADDEIRIFCAAASAALTMRNCQSPTGKRTTTTLSSSSSTMTSSTIHHDHKTTMPKRKKGRRSSLSVANKRSKGKKKTVKFAIDRHDSDVSEISTSITSSEVDSHRDHSCSLCPQCNHNGRTAEECSRRRHPSSHYDESSRRQSSRRSSSSSSRNSFNQVSQCDNINRIRRGSYQQEPEVSWDELGDAIEAGRRVSIEDSATSKEEVEEELLTWDDLDGALEEGLRRSIEDLSNQVFEKQEQRLNRLSMRRNSTASVFKEVRFDL